MHAFLVFGVLIEAFAIGILFWRVCQNSIGIDAGSAHADKIVAEHEAYRSLQLQSDAVRDQLHADLARQVGIGGDETASRLVEFQAALHQWKGDAELQIKEIDSKIADLSEGCEKIDADLSVTSEDVRECVKLRQSDLAGLNERITKIADAQEKARRKSGLRGAPAAYESIRSVAEASAAKQSDPGRATLVTLAEG